MAGFLCIVQERAKEKGLRPSGGLGRADDVEDDACFGFQKTEIWGMSGKGGF